jgi:signal peptidase I
MIIGIGTDIIKIDRIRGLIAEYRDKFLHRCFTPSERERADTKHDPAHAYARLYAAKEALLKALGTGMRDGISWQDVQISWNKYGAPTAIFGPGARTYLSHNDVNISLSMSDDGEYAVAFAIIEKNMTRDIQPTKQNSVYETVKTIFFAGIIALGIRSVAYEPFSIPSGSMIPTLQVGDYLFVSKYSYGYSQYSFPLTMVPFQGRLDSHSAARGDVVVFRKPHNEDIDYIKRVIGLPGDTIQVKDGRLYINHKIVQRTYIDDVEVKTPPSFKKETYKRYTETLPEGYKHEIIEKSDHEFLDNTPEYVVPENHYFMMGDNRDGSQDSRVMSEVGFVPFDNFVGKAQNIFFSVDDDYQIWQIWKWPVSVRAKRIFQKII